jgi:predicted SAM-dependent methyltransferase
MKLTPEAEEARSQIFQYLRSRARRHVEPTRPFRRFAKRVLPARWHYPLREAATDALMLRERRRARALAGDGPPRLQLGSGRRRKPGWINVDLAFGAPVDLAWRLPRRLPFASGSVDAIFHEHLLEHLPLESAVSLLDECHRLLRPGGILRVGVPDAGAYLEAYAQVDKKLLETLRPNRPTRLLAVQEVFYLPGHRTMYDLQTLTLVLAASGFTESEPRSFGDSRLRPAPDSEARRFETLYVEAIR